MKKKKSFAKTTVYQVVGGSQGTDFDDTPQAIKLAPANEQYSPGIAELHIRSGEILDSIQAIYADQEGKIPTSGQPGQHGGNGGSAAAPIKLATEGDYITEVSGLYGNWYGATYILQITLKTVQGETYGPFGTAGGSSSQTPFKFPPQGAAKETGVGRLLAFSGRTVQAPEAGGGFSTFVSALGATFVYFDPNS